MADTIGNVLDIHNVKVKDFGAELQRKKSLTRRLWSKVWNPRARHTRRAKLMRRMGWDWNLDIFQRRPMGDAKCGVHGTPTTSSFWTVRLMRANLSQGLWGGIQSRSLLMDVEAGVVTGFHVWHSLIASMPSWEHHASTSVSSAVLRSLRGSPLIVPHYSAVVGGEGEGNYDNISPILKYPNLLEITRRMVASETWSSYPRLSLVWPSFGECRDSIFKMFQIIIWHFVG